MSIKNFFLLFFFCYTNTALADVLIFNESVRYDMDVKYNFCSGDYDYNCTPEAIISIKHMSNNAKDVNYTTIPVPQVTATQQFFNIISVTQKDESGTLVAQALYNMNEVDGFECGARTIQNDPIRSKVSTAYYLKDHAQLPIITCQKATYNKELMK